MMRQDDRTRRLGRRSALLGGAAVGAAALLSLGASAAGLQATSDDKKDKEGKGLIEPNAGTWKTWLLSSGSQLRLPPPPGGDVTQAEIKDLKTLAAQRDQATLDKISFWDIGSPAFRWNEIAVNECLKHSLNINRASRILALLNVAIYDATIAAWDTKYAYNRKRPSEANASLETAVPNPASPSYPSEHAVTAGAASAVLAYAFPDIASAILARADEAGQSRVLAGVQYPSDVAAGLELGRKVGALAVERGKADGSDAVWTGTIPVGPGYWTGTNPIEPMAGTWKTWVLDSGSQLRPGPPPAYNSPEKAAELTEIKTFPRTPRSNTVAFFWQYAVGGSNGYQYWYEQTTQKISQYRLDDNPPRAARAYALQNIALYESAIACFDAKYAYWATRPFQLDADVKTLFPTPNHPSYPAAHSSLSGATAAMMGYLFPSDAAHFKAMGEEAGESRIWAGIHYRSDNTVGLTLGRAVTAKVVERAQGDGS